MKKNRKIVKHFFAILYCLAMAIPLFSVVYYQIDGLGDYTKFQEDNSNGNSQYEDLPQTYYEKVEYHTNEVNSVDDLVVGNVYKFYFEDQVGIGLNWSDSVSGNLYDNNIPIVSFFVEGGSEEYVMSDYIYGDFYYNINTNFQVYTDFTDDFWSLILTYIDYNEGDTYYISSSLPYNTNNYFQFILDSDFYNFIDINAPILITNKYIGIADLTDIVPTYIEKTMEKKQYYFDDAFGKSYLDFAYGGSKSYSQYYQSIEGNTYEDTYSMFTSNDNDEYTQMLLNYDYLNLMGVDGLFSNNHRGAWYLWLNFYLNYLLNMAIIIFMPEVLMIFIQWCRNLIYSFTEKVGE